MYMSDFYKTEYLSKRTEILVGHGSLKIYGKPDCSFVLRHPIGTSYARRVLFGREEDALAAGYRPCAVCMKEHHRLWKAGRLMTHALDVVEVEHRNEPGLCSVCLANGSRKTLKLRTLKDLDPDSSTIYKSDWVGYELAEFKIEGDYCVITTVSHGETWGRVIVWDYVQDRIVHLTAAPFAQCSAVFKGQVVSMYLARHWFDTNLPDLRESASRLGNLWYSVVPLGQIDPTYEPELYLLPLTLYGLCDWSNVYDIRDTGKKYKEPPFPNAFDIYADGDTLVFRAENREYRLDSL